MRFRHELDYDAPPAAVFAMLADPAFREAVCAAQDVVSADVTIEPYADGFNLVVDQVQRTGELPSIAKKFAGDTTQAIQRESWTDPSGGSLVIEAPGKPTTATGRITLEARGTGTREIVTLDIKVSVPLIGGRLEKLVAEQVQTGMDVEHTVGIAYLQGK